MNSSNISNNLTAIPFVSFNFDLIIGYLCLINVVIGVSGNSLCFIVFQSNKDLRKMSYAIYLSFCAITDTLSLFTWNLDYFIQLYSIRIEYTNLFNCRLFSFLQYFSLECSAWLLSFVCIDRFVTVVQMPGSFMSKLPFSTQKTARTWSILIILFFFIANLHLLGLNGYITSIVSSNVTKIYKINGTIINITVIQYTNRLYCYYYSPSISLQLWDQFHMYAYSFVPFVIMIIFNSLLVFKTLMPPKFHHKPKSDNHINEKRRITISLLTINFAFCLMTFPGSFVYGYLYGQMSKSQLGKAIMHFLDYFSLLNRASLFLNCFIANKNFRKALLKFYLAKLNNFRKRKSTSVHPIQ